MVKSSHLTDIAFHVVEEHEDCYHDYLVIDCDCVLYCNFCVWIPRFVKQAMDWVKEEISDLTITYIAFQACFS